MKSNTLELERWEWEQLKAIVKAAREVSDYLWPSDREPAIGKLTQALAAWDANKEAE
jgi:hypothetical protein